MALRLNGSSSGYVELDVPAAAGSHTLTLPDGGGSSGQYLQTNGSGGLSWAGVTTGKILQVVQDSDNAAADLGSIGAGSDSSAVLTVSITPTYSNSKMLILVNAKAGTSYAYMAMRIKKDGTALAGMTGAGSSTYRAHVAAQGWTSITNAVQQCNFDAKYVETLSGASTSTAISYTVHFVNTDNSANSLYFNRAYNDSDTETRSRTFSSLIVMEIAP